MANNYTTATDKHYFYGLLVPVINSCYWIGTTLWVTWDDPYEPDMKIEVWGVEGGTKAVLLGKVDSGDKSISLSIDNSKDYTITLRATNNMAYSEFSEPFNIEHYFEVPLNSPAIFVSTTGDDVLGDGSILNPYATIQKGFDEVTPGTTLYIRGGRYQPIGTYIATPFGTDWYASAGATHKSGTADNPIRVYNYPGELPILDGVNNTAANNGGAGSRFNILLIRCSYWHIKGIEVTGVVQLPGELGVSAIRIQDYSHHNIIEQVVSHHNGGSGISFLYDCDDNRILNCDCYNNYDHLSVPNPGNNSDGIEIADITRTDYTNYIEGCRVWDNSDDGVDLMRNEGRVVIKNTWAFINGQTAAYQATGFKLGQCTIVSDIIGREVINCIAAYNMNGGIVLNISSQRTIILNNTVIGNGWHGITWYSTVPHGASIMKNNVSYGNLNYNFSYISAAIDFQYNSDNQYEVGRPVISDADFVTAAVAELQAARNADGSLPTLTTFHPDATSGVIGQGTNVGLDTDGDNKPYANPPSIGCYEYV